MCAFNSIFNVKKILSRCCILKVEFDDEYNCLQYPDRKNLRIFCVFIYVRHIVSEGYYNNNEKLNSNICILSATLLHMLSRRWLEFSLHIFALRAIFALYYAVIADAVCVCGRQPVNCVNKLTKMRRKGAKKKSKQIQSNQRLFSQHNNACARLSVEYLRKVFVTPWQSFFHVNCALISYHPLQFIRSGNEMWSHSPFFRLTFHSDVACKFDDSCRYDTERIHRNYPSLHIRRILHIFCASFVSAKFKNFKYCR